MRELRVLVVDDSPTNRRLIGSSLTSGSGVQIVGEASDGNEALKLALSLLPDVITLDLEMPKMDGFTFLRLLMAKRPTPVIVVSSYASKDNVFRALELGAIDFVEKPTRGKALDAAALGDALRAKVDIVRYLSRSSLEARRAMAERSPITAVRSKGALDADPTLPRRVLLFGASTGGPAALIEIFKRLPATGSYAAIIAQHMPEHFTHGFAQRLHRLGRIEVSEVFDARELRRNQALVCPGGACVEVIEQRGRVYAHSREPRPEDRFVPSADRLFESAARVLGRRAVAVVLTGMGDDGAVGVRAVKEAGGLVFAEAQETATVPSMPEATVRTGLCDDILPLPELGDRLAELLA